MAPDEPVAPPFDNTGSKIGVKQVLHWGRLLGSLLVLQMQLAHLVCVASLVPGW